MKKSPLAPEKFPVLPMIKNVFLGTAATAMKYKNRDDLLLVSFPEGAEVAGVFTTSKCYSAPVGWCRDMLAKQKPAKALLVNAGNANAFTGKAGDDAMAATIKAVSENLACDIDEIYVASTGVIGQVLNATLMKTYIGHAASNRKENNWNAAAGAILTTDTFPKGATQSVKIGNDSYVINGFVKGSGMIAPDMATMLGFIFTDAPIKQNVLQSLLKEACDLSFNNITVDSDTSTSDTLLAFATGKENMINDSNDPVLDDFKTKLSVLMLDLAHQIVRDGEGANKFISVKVVGAENDAAAKKIAMSIANSPLVKTAIAGEDANWGRIVMAVGKAGEKADRDKLIIHIGGQKVTEHGMGVEGYDEAICTAHLKGQEIDIEVDIGIAGGKAEVWTCDLTYDYIKINADYRS